jgi:hypothetical protein
MHKSGKIKFFPWTDFLSCIPEQICNEFFNLLMLYMSSKKARPDTFHGTLPNVLQTFKALVLVQNKNLHVVQVRHTCTCTTLLIP